MLWVASAAAWKFACRQICGETDEFGQSLSIFDMESLHLL
jgi:hypothetical protein